MAAGEDRWAAERMIKTSDLPAPSRLVLLVLLTRVTKGTLDVPSEYAPSLMTLGRETGLAKSTVADHLRDLERSGWLERRRPTTKKAMEERLRTGYRVLIPVRETDQSESRTSSGAGQVKEEPLFTTGPGDGPVREPDGTSPGSGHSPKYSPKPSSSPKEKKKGGVGGKKPRSPKGDEAHPAFADWYRVYPRKVDPAKARAAFAKAVKKVDDPQVLITAAKRYRDTDPHVARGYIKNPATWLNAEAWLNELGDLGATGTDGPRSSVTNPNHDEQEYYGGF